MEENDKDPTRSEQERKRAGQLLLNELTRMTGQAKAQGSIDYLLELLKSGMPTLHSPPPPRLIGKSMAT